MATQNEITPATILFVEDEPLVRYVGSDILSEAGYRVFEAGDADEALRVLEHEQIDILVSDVRMPGSMNGLDLSAVAHRKWPDLKLLLTSGDTMLTRDRIPDDGHFLAKPYQAHQLRGEIRALLNSR